MLASTKIPKPNKDHFTNLSSDKIEIDNGHLNSQYDDMHSANRMALMTEAAVNLAAAMRIGQQQQQNQHQQNNQQNNQQQHQVSSRCRNGNNNAN